MSIASLGRSALSSITSPDDQSWTVSVGKAWQGGRPLDDRRCAVAGRRWDRWTFAASCVGEGGRDEMHGKEELRSEKSPVQRSRRSHGSLVTSWSSALSSNRDDSDCVRCIRRGCVGHRAYPRSRLQRRSKVVSTSVKGGVSISRSVGVGRGIRYVDVLQRKPW